MLVHSAAARQHQQRVSGAAAVSAAAWTSEGGRRGQRGRTRVHDMLCGRVPACKPRSGHLMTLAACGLPPVHCQRAAAGAAHEQMRPAPGAQTGQVPAHLGRLRGRAPLHAKVLSAPAARLALGRQQGRQLASGQGGAPARVCRSVSTSKSWAASRCQASQDVLPTSRGAQKDGLSSLGSGRGRAHHVGADAQRLCWEVVRARLVPVHVLRGGPSVSCSGCSSTAVARAPDAALNAAGMMKGRTMAVRLSSWAGDIASWK